MLNIPKGGAAGSADCLGKEFVFALDGCCCVVLILQCNATRRGRKTRLGSPVPLLPASVLSEETIDDGDNGSGDRCIRRGLPASPLLDQLMVLLVRDANTAPNGSSNPNF